MAKHKLIFFLAVLIILADLVATFVQYSRTAIDGDVVSIVLPVPTYQHIFSDPFAIDAIFHGAQYSGSGRYCCHVLMYFLFRPFYNFLNQFTGDRINALYLTATIYQWFCNWVMAITFSLYINIGKKFNWKLFVYAIALTIPFFQYHHGYTNDEIIDRAVTYTTFYAFPATILLLFFYPFFRSVFYKRSTSSAKLVFAIQLIPGALLIFSGPLIPVIGSLLFIVLIVFQWLDATRYSLSLSKSLAFSRQIKTAAITFIPLWLYSFYAGRFNVENSTAVMVSERYGILFSQFFSYFFQYGLPFSLALLVMNLFFLRKYDRAFFKSRTFQYMKVLAAFILFYLLLLPLGGYRSYRPNILRYDTTMPLTIYLLISNIAMTLMLVNLLKGNLLKIFSILTFVILVTYWYQNFPISDGRSEQEKMLRILAASKSDSTVCLPYSSNFFAWNKIETPEQSIYVSQMLYEWGILRKPILFYQK